MKKKFKKYYNFTNVIVHDTIYVYAEYEPFTSKIFNFKDVRNIEEDLGYNYMDLKATLYSMNETMMKISLKLIRIVHAFRKEREYAFRIINNRR